MTKFPLTKSPLPPSDNYRNRKGGLNPAKKILING